MKAMTAERCSGIKSGYWSAEKKEDLVQQLGLYEHQVLSPAKIEQFQKLRTRCCVSIWLEIRIPARNQQNDREAISCIVIVIQ